jgi:hypothetical protein
MEGRSWSRTGAAFFHLCASQRSEGQWRRLRTGDGLTRRDRAYSTNLASFRGAIAQ